MIQTFKYDKKEYSAIALGEKLKIKPGSIYSRYRVIRKEGLNATKIINDEVYWKARRDGRRSSIKKTTVMPVFIKPVDQWLYVARA